MNNTTRFATTRKDLLIRIRGGSFCETATFATKTTTTTPATSVADIVKGPSLVRTSNLSRPRPSMLHLPGLRSLPYWTQYVPNSDQNMVAYGDPAITAVVRHLDTHWENIWNEFQSVSKTLPSDYQTDTEHHILHQGKWDWHSYMTKGVVDHSHKTQFHRNFPVTTAILEELRNNTSETQSALCRNQLFEGTPFGYSFFSTLHNNANIQPHAGPMNFRLRVHVPLSVPTLQSTNDANGTSNPRPACGIRVGGVTREWYTGKSLVLDDSFVHEVWNDTTERRVLLLVDLWHPDVTLQERKEIIQMFQTAKDKGWLS
jgi:hypothetical protein